MAEAHLCIFSICIGKKINKKCCKKERNSLLNKKLFLFSTRFSNLISWSRSFAVLSTDVCILFSYFCCSLISLSKKRWHLMVAPQFIKIRKFNRINLAWINSSVFTNYLVVGSNPIAVNFTSHIVSVSSKEFLDFLASSQWAIQISSHNPGQSFGQFR